MKLLSSISAVLAAIMTTWSDLGEVYLRWGPITLELLLIVIFCPLYLEFLRNSKLKYDYINILITFTILIGFWGLEVHFAVHNPYPKLDDLGYSGCILLFESLLIRSVLRKDSTIS